MNRPEAAEEISRSHVLTGDHCTVTIEARMLALGRFDAAC